MSDDSISEVVASNELVSTIFIIGELKYLWSADSIRNRIGLPTG